MGKKSDYVTRADVEEIVERIVTRAITANNKTLLEDIVGVINDLGFRMQEYIHEKTAPIPQIQKDVKALKEDVKVLKEDVAVLKTDVKILKSDVRYLKSTADNQTKRLFRLEAVDDKILGTLKLDQKQLGQYTWDMLQVPYENYWIR